jgi:hypothetical protein
MKHKTLIAALLITLIGGAYLAWYNVLDGNVMNPPITWRNGTDPPNLKTEKHTYRPGETVRAYTSFCKTRNAKTTTQWALSDHFLTIYAQTPEANIPPGCYPLVGTSTTFAIEEIPFDAAPGCDYFFAGLRSADIGGGRIRTQGYRTEKFCVTQ